MAGNTTAATERRSGPGLPPSVRNCSKFWELHAVAGKGFGKGLATTCPKPWQRHAARGMSTRSQARGWARPHLPERARGAHRSQSFPGLSPCLGTLRLIGITLQPLVPVWARPSLSPVATNSEASRTAIAQPWPQPVPPCFPHCHCPLMHPSRQQTPEAS